MNDLMTVLRLKAKGCIWFRTGDELVMLQDKDAICQFQMRPDLHELFISGQRDKMADIAERTPMPYGYRDAGVMELIEYCMSMAPPEWSSLEEKNE